MEVIKKYVSWLWWTCYYAVTPRSKDFGHYIRSLERRRVPWWKFQPHIYHRDGWSAWECSWKQGRHYVSKMMLQVEAHIDCETEEIIGVTVYDEICKPPYQPWKPPPYYPPPGTLSLEEAVTTGCCRICGGRLLEPNAKGEIEPLPLWKQFGECVWPARIITKFGEEFSHPDCVSAQ